MDSTHKFGSSITRPEPSSLEELHHTLSKFNQVDQVPIWLSQALAASGGESSRWKVNTLPTSKIRELYQLLVT
jgi:hypothetical protein